MSDTIPDTENVARRYCPICEPDADPCREVLDALYCEPHRPTCGGLDDERAPVLAYLSGSGECGGDDNRRWNDLLLRGRA